MKLIVALIAITALASCVSGRKYNESVLERQRLEQQMNNQQQSYTDLETKYQSLQASNDQLRTEIDQLKSANKFEASSVSDKEKMLQQKEKNLEELQALINDQKAAIANLQQEVCSALKCFTPDELKVEVRDGKLYVSLSDKLLFQSGSDKVNDRGQEAIQMLSGALANSDLEIMVEGHTDNVPINTTVNKDNWDLSVRRATSVSRIMIDNGIKPDRIIASGRGEFHPVASNSDADGRQQNRRTEIVLAPKLDRLWKLTEASGSSAMK